MAFFLLWFSYMLNLTTIGVVVLIVHDPGDVFLILARGYADMKKVFMPVLVLFFVLSYTFWVYTRNYVTPFCLVKGGFNILTKIENLSDQRL